MAEPRKAKEAWVTRSGDVERLTSRAWTRAHGLVRRGDCSLIAAEGLSSTTLLPLKGLAGWHGEAHVLAKVMHGRLRGPSALRQSKCRERGVPWHRILQRRGRVLRARSASRMNRVRQGLFRAGRFPGPAKYLFYAALIYLKLSVGRKRQKLDRSSHAYLLSIDSYSRM